MRRKIMTGILLLIMITARPQGINIISPNQKISIELFSEQNAGIGEWFLKVNYINNGQRCEAIPKITLGLSRSDQDFSKDLKLIKAGKPVLIEEQYSALHGKRSQCSNSANERVVSFENQGKAKMNLIIRAYNDGVAFRYEFPDKEGTYVVNDEFTSYNIHFRDKALDGKVEYCK